MPQQSTARSHAPGCGVPQGLQAAAAVRCGPPAPAPHLESLRKPYLCERRVTRAWRSSVRQKLACRLEARRRVRRTRTAQQPSHVARSTRAKALRVGRSSGDAAASCKRAAKSPLWARLRSSLLLLSRCCCSRLLLSGGAPARRRARSQSRAMRSRGAAASSRRLRSSRSGREALRARSAATSPSPQLAPSAPVAAHASLHSALARCALTDAGRSVRRARNVKGRAPCRISPLTWQDRVRRQ